MPQETNLNVSPYFDDFDANKDYYKVLFKPAYPIQARELTTLQSILQNQIEQFGKHIFKEGSPVIDGQISTDIPFPSIQVESEFNGVPISVYFNSLLDKKIRGATSGVVAQIKYLLSNIDSEKGNYTLYLNYLQSGGADFTSQVFLDGETLLLEEPLTYGNLTIQSGQGVCNTISTNASSSGSSIAIREGIYFIRGFFAKVLEQRILLDQYGTQPSYKVGFNVIERIVTADEDESLYDNAQGFSNYGAPGADRFQVELELVKKNLDDNEVGNFVELYRIIAGVPQYPSSKTQYSLIRDEMAKRTADQSGDFFVKPFTLFVRDSLNDRLVNSTGVYFDGQTTVNGNTPSDDMMVYQIGPGKAYVNGYDVETIAPKLLDVEKARTTATLSDQTISYNAGTSVVVNNAYGAVPVGLGTTAVVVLRNSRLGSDKSQAAGTEIGRARIYDFVPESNYSDQTSRLDLRLFDIQTYTVIGLTTAITQTTPAFIQGKKSNAGGYLKSNVSSSDSLTLYSVSGTFLKNEPIVINGIDNGRLIKTVTDYSTADIKSIYSQIGVSTFNADLVLDNEFYIAPTGTVFNITAASGGISTVSSGLGTNFVNKISAGDIISYDNPSTGGDVVYNKVETVSAGGTNFTISAITSVSKVCAGNLPASNVNVTNIYRLTSTLDSNNSSLITSLDRSNVVSLDLTSSEIKQRRTFTNQSFSGSSITVTITEPDLYFDSFNQDRFLIAYSDGSIESLSFDKYSLDTTGKQLTFYGLSKVSGTADVTATIKNLKPNSKIKKLNKAGSLIVNYSKYSSSGIGTTSLNDGLTYSQVYGVRVQDDQICLNVPDAIRVLAVYESASTSDPALPQIQLTSFTGPTNNNQDFSIGEQILGKDSGAIAVVVNRISVDKLEYVYLNASQFIEGEIIVGKESTTQATITTRILGDKNITQNFIFDDGQRESFYDYSRIIRKRGFEEPKGKLRIIFQNYTIDQSDTGEFITANSYPSDGFKNDVPLFENNRVSDYIDIRPRVSTYTLSSKSPFEFDSRSFAGEGQYSRYPLAPQENITASYSYYLPRFDRVFLNQDGTFEVVKGIPADSPSAPELRSTSLDIATIKIPPYVHDIKNVMVDMSKHRRYLMSDISVLEDRIQRIEEFTTLSMLESKTQNFTIKDAETGLDRFKCGFFVDDFTSHLYHDADNPIFRSAIDETKKTLRPLHYSTSLDLELGSETISGISNNFSPTADKNFVSDLGSPGVKKTGDLVTLNYEEVLYDQQTLATRDESVTAFLVAFWTGKIKLNPAIDTWYDERSVTTTSTKEVKNVVVHPDVNETITKNEEENVTSTLDPVVQSGTTPFDWIANAKATLGTNKRLTIGKGGAGGKEGRTLEITSKGAIRINGLHIGKKDRALLEKYLPSDVVTKYINTMKGKGGYIEWTPPTYETQSSTKLESSTTTSTASTSSVTTVITPEEITTTESVSQSTSNYTEPVKYLRSRNIQFDTSGLKSATQFYAFFQGIDVSKYIIPKLIEIEMISGTFQAGETVTNDPTFTAAKISFRLCNANHQSGPYNNPTEVYKLIPYTQQAAPTSYSASSTFLNVDTLALQLPSEPDFYGQIASNMTLIGRTSGAKAKIKNIRLISDNYGRLIGSLFIPDPKIPENPMWINGENTFTLTDVNSLNVSPEEVNVGGTYLNQSSGSAVFTSSGTTNVTETNILTTQNITITPAWRTNTTTITNTTTNTTTITPVTVETTVETAAAKVKIQQPYDPLAQSFYVFEDTGIFLTSVDVYFKTKSADMSVTLQIRPLLAGVPSNVTVPFSEVTLNPEQINLSTDGTVATKFVFPSPVYLLGPQQQTVKQAPIASNTQAEYAIVLLSNSPDYRVFISRLGENDILTGTKVSKQPTLGSLFKSQNGTTWNPSQYDDLKYDIYRANFVTEGLVRFFNPKLGLGNKKLTVTGPNQFLPLSKRIIVGLGSTGYASDIAPGVTLSQGSATGTLIGIAGSITVGTGVTVSSVGVGYTNGTFTDVSLVSETGYGQGAKATVITSANAINTVTITSGGSGYQIGDSLLIPSIGTNVGFGGKVVVSTISSNNTFVIDNVQGSFASGISTLSYTNSSGITTYVGAAVTVSSITQDQYYDGLHMKVSHINHSMHSTQNFVKISEMRPLNNDVNTKTSADLTASETSSISVVSGIGFTTFEGVSVSASNPGYVIIGYEVIQYTGVSGNTLTTLTRGIDGTQAISYNSGTAVYKYEFNGVSLRRINKVHNFAEVDTTTHPIDINSYYIKIDTDSTDFDGVGIGSNRSNDLYFRKTAQMGQSGTVITNNIQYESIFPKIATIIPGKTDLTAKIRTFSGTSVGGNETSFVDNGFQDIALTNVTYFDTPNIICSDVNESRLITGSPGNRSLTVQLLMTSTDSRVSPVIDITNASIETYSNLINNPVGIQTATAYALDDSVRDLYNDKHTTIYVSKPVKLKLAANSLKVFLSASRNNMNDVRVLYRLFRDDSLNTSQNYELFPGYSNYKIDGLGIKRVIDPSMNDGSADSFVQETDDRSFKDYEYSVDDLPDFTGFSIKIVMASTNQATPPLIKDLRAIATIKPTA